MSAIISMQTYENAASLIKSQQYKRDCLQLLAKQFPLISHDTFMSIYSQLFQQYTKQVHHTHRQSAVMREYYDRYLSKTGSSERISDSPIIVDMANEIMLAPTLLARIILEEHIHRNNLTPAEGAVNTLVSQWIKSPHLIESKSLQNHVCQCILADANYGPLAENIKHSIGYQYEFLLAEKVKELKIPFLGEKELSARGYDKTPDVKLEVPLALESGHIVNWIESKASFGDKPNHSKYLEEQFWSYTNRFGSGLVIYWFGYIQELDVHQAQGILLSDHFPATSTITIMHN